MRRIGTIDSGGYAKRFSDFLYTQGIESQIDQNDEGHWEVWILNEQRIDDARAQLEAFAQDPSNPKYGEIGARAAERRQQDEAERQRRAGNVIDPRARWIPLGGDKLGWLTGALIAVSIVVAIMSGIGSKPQKLMPLHITAYEVEIVGDKARVKWNGTLPEIREGEVWRLITPIFIHYGFLHILFNMWWLKDLGSMIERRQNTWMLLLVVVFSAAASNYGQFRVSGPTFGGMSGVVYALLGYAWIRGRFDPRSGLHVPPQIVHMMMIWFVLCILFTQTGAFPVANTAHGVGLGVGAVLGAVTSRGLRRRLFGSRTT